MIRLDNTTRSLGIVLGGAVATNELHTVVSFTEKEPVANTASAYLLGQTQLATTNGATDVTICAAPAQKFVRDIDYVSVRNRDTAAATVSIEYDDNGTDTIICSATLAVGDMLVYTEQAGWFVLDSSGRLKSSAGVGVPGTSTDNAFVRWDGTSGTALQNSVVIADDSGNVSGVVNLTTTGDTTLGTSTSAMTLNAVTWTYGANYTATRAAGTVANGTVNLLTHAVTFTGDASGGSGVRGFHVTLTQQGGNAVTNAAALNAEASHSGTATNTTLRAARLLAAVASTGNATNMHGATSVFSLPHAGSVTNGDHFDAAAPSMTSTGLITTLAGFRARNQGNTLVSTAIGFACDDFTNSAAMRGLSLALSSGTGKHNVYASGTAQNYFEGRVGIGIAVPLSKLHIEGASGWLIADEQDANPTTAELDANDAVAFYNKANTLVFAYANGTNMTYVKLPLDGSATAWTHDTTPP